MTTSRLEFALLVCAGLLSAPSIFGQGYPLPSNTLQTCGAACPGNESAKIFPYGPPIIAFTGRYLDSSNSLEYQFPFRTARARIVVRVASDRHRVYMLIGSAMAAYDIDTFFSRLAAREALTPVTQVPVTPSVTNRRSRPEEFLMWDQFFYAESGGGWQIPLADGQDRLFDFDWDDRGFVYLAYSVFGWGVVRDSGGTGGGWMPHDGNDGFQISHGSDYDPISVVSIKASDGSYYAITSGYSSSTSKMWYVGDAAGLKNEPRGERPVSIMKWAKADSGRRIGFIDYTNFGVRIYTNDGLVSSSGSPVAQFAGPYSGFDSDGTNFYAMCRLPGGSYALSVFTPSGNSYTETRYALGTTYLQDPFVRAGNSGYVTVFGFEDQPFHGQNLRLYRMGNTGPVEVSLTNTAGNVTGPFIPYYYSASTPAGFVHPNWVGPENFLVYKAGTKYYLIVAEDGLGDVYELRGADTLTASVKSVHSSSNTNSTNKDAGPFYGDNITFTSDTSALTKSDVLWSFGDGTSASAPALQPDIAHQYSGQTALSLPAKLTIKATSGDMSSTLPVTLGKPELRLGIAGNSALLFLLPDTSSAAPIVTSDSFVDASDGGVESHYDDWQLDGAAATHAIPSGPPFPVGACGPHSLVFTAHYGPYDPSNFALAAGSDAQFAINSFNYTARPFAVQVGDPTTTANTVSFPAIVFTSKITDDLPQGKGTNCKYTWELLPATNAVPLRTGTATLGSIPAFDGIPRSSFGDSARQVRLTVEVTDTLRPPCSSLSVSTNTLDNLSGPSAMFECPFCSPGVSGVSGCEKIGQPCSFTVFPLAIDSSKWNYNWAVTSGPAAVTGLNGTGPGFTTFSPAFKVAGTYQVSVDITNAIGSLTVPAPAVTLAPGQACPTLTASSVYLGYSGPQSGCTPSYGTCNAGEAVTFTLYPQNGYPLGCATHTYSWNFGDGVTSSEVSPTHAYNSSGTFTASLTLSNGLDTTMISASVRVGGGGTVITGCSTLSSSSVYIGFSGPQSGCTSSFSTCSAGENIAFTAYAQNGYNLGCASHSYQWNFGDGGTSTSSTPSHPYAANGTYSASLTIGNGSQSATLSFQVKVGGTTLGNGCSTLTSSSVYVAYSGSQSTCTSSFGTCNAGESIAFTVYPLSGYNLNCATHTYSWNFGDGGTSTSSTPSHPYAANGTYNGTVTVNNGSQAATLNFQVKVGTTSGSGCASLTSNSAYFVWNGETSQCTAISGTCQAGEKLDFTVYPQNGYTLNCITGYSWNFGDGSTSTAATPQHTFSEGTFNVVLTLSSGSQTAQITKSAKIGSGVTGTKPACGTPTTLCVDQGLYDVSLTAITDPRTNKKGTGSVIDQNDTFGYFSIDLTGNPTNPDVFVKVLGPINGKPWVFYAGLTDLNYTITVTDKATGKKYKDYPVSSAFDPFKSTGNFDVNGSASTQCDDMTITRVTDLFAPTSCTPDTNTLCLLNNRFMLQLSATDVGRTGKTGKGQAIPKTDAYAFFSVPDLTGNPANVEVFVKMIDARTLDNHFWLFLGGLTDFEYTLRAIDTVTGMTNTYKKPAGSTCGRNDVPAF